jgi:hypothetical protein
LRRKTASATAGDVTTTLDEIRADGERDLTALFASLDERHRRMLENAIGEYGTVRNIPDSFWAQLSEDIRTAKDDENRTAAGILLLILADSDEWTADQMARQGVRVPALTPSEMTDYSLAMAGRIDDLANSSVKTLRNRLTRKAQDSQLTGPGEIGELTDEGLAQALDDVLTDSRIETIATDQTTQAITAGQRGAGDRVAGGEGAEAGAGGLTVALIWRTEKDNLVCPRCAPLEGQPEEVWALVFPEGPGPDAHPNCRCSLEPQVVRATVTESLRESEGGDEDGHWVTINGQHVLIDEQGVVQSDGPMHGKHLGKDHATAAIEPDDLLSAKRIEPINGVRKPELFQSLVNDFSDGGWKGRPIVVVDGGDHDYRALTGSHRILAARAAGIEVPSVIVPEKKLDINLGDSGYTLRGLLVGDDDMRATAFEQAAKKDQSLNKAARLLRAEVNLDPDF